ncbi:repulsive guidance molecule A-like [Penaeus monodon]|uniref:repulsive guidance molecule A-like n=1 Tax=Penaeus monodon TaxID=6687 RepID=UPI0018A6ECA7|nr:repulsive guidance molecule A-like [Penaeus monodon]
MWPPTPHPPRAGLTTLLLTTLLTAGVAKECAVSECTATFHEGTNAGVQKGPTLAYCQLLQAYKACLEETRSSCRGDIHYLSASGMASHVATNNNCSRILSGELAPSASAGGATLAPAAAATDADDLCRYRAAAVAAPAHCGLFGDPHLKTFAGAYMTCRVQGAWPLLNTPDIAIQVTNEPVGPDNYATATTKVGRRRPRHSGLSSGGGRAPRSPSCRWLPFCACPGLCSLSLSLALSLSLSLSLSWESSGGVNPQERL